MDKYKYIGKKIRHVVGPVGDQPTAGLEGRHCEVCGYHVCSCPAAPSWTQAENGPYYVKTFQGRELRVTQVGADGWAGYVNWFCVAGGSTKYAAMVSVEKVVTEQMDFGEPWDLTPVSPTPIAKI